MTYKYTIPKAFEKSALSNPDKIALQMAIDGEYVSVTYRELLTRANNIASYFISDGIIKGDRIAICLKTCPEWAVAYLGIVMAGAVAVPIDAELEVEDIRNILTHSKGKVIFICDENRDKISKASEGLGVRIINLGSKEYSDLCNQNHSYDNLRLPEVSETDIASIVYTSGTTGIPKGVMLSHKNFCFDAFSIIESGLITRDDNLLGLLPLHHTYPFMTTLLTPLIAGATVTYLTVLKGPEIVKTMKECNITIFIGVPQLFDMLLRGIRSKLAPVRFKQGMEIPILEWLADICGVLRRITGINFGKIIFSKVHKNMGNRLRFFASGGAKLDPDVGRGLFSLGFTIIEGYGLTETSPIAALNPEKKLKIGSVGLPIPDVEIKIINQDKDGVGEIVIKGPIVMKGYYLNPEETGKAIKDNWLQTGDSGYIDKDGYLYITGRIKEVIVLSSGKNIYPEEIEKYYSANPLIKEICVIGVENKSGITEHLNAVIVPNPDYIKEKDIANIYEAVKQEVQSLSANIPSYKRIMGFRITEEPLPRTALGKIRRFLVKEFLKGEKKQEKRQISAEDQVIMQDPSVRKMLAYLKGVTKKERINLDDNLEIDLGIDSLQRVELAVAIEEIFGTKLPEGFSAEVSSVGELVKKIMEIRGTPIERIKVNRWSKLFEEEPEDDDKKKVGLNHGVISKLLSTSMLIFLKAISKLIFRLEVKGIENLPKPPYVITPNHTSFMDGFIIASAVPFSTFYNLYFVAIQEYFNNAVTKTFARIAHVIPINTEAHLYRALQLSGFVLRERYGLCLFPEGGISVDGKLKSFKKGVGILSKELNVPLIPAIIDGTFSALPRGSWLPRPVKITVSFGKPLYPSDIDFSKKPDGIDEYEWISMQLRENMIKLMETE